MRASAGLSSAHANGIVADPVETLAREALRLAPVWADELHSDRLLARFGPVRVRIDACGSVITQLALEGMRHAQETSEGAADLRIVVIDSMESGLDAPPVWTFPATGDRAHRCWQRFDDGLEVGLDLAQRTWAFLDREQGLALIWSADASVTPEWVFRNQLRNILHWWSRGSNWGLFHAAALRFGEAACLVTGKSGSGKSTLTASAVANGISTAGDDFVLIETAGASPRVHAVFHTIKLDELGLGRAPAFRPYAFKPVESPREKFLVRLLDAAPNRLASDFPLHAILHSRVTGNAETRIARSTPSRAFHSLAPSTVFELRSQENEIFARTAALVRLLPVYSLELGTEIGNATDALRRFLSGLQT